MRLHHVNVIVGAGLSDAVAPFYELLGLTRVAKPNSVPGAWFDLPDGRTQLHVSERPGSPHPDQHFALTVDDLDSLVAVLTGAGHPWRTSPEMYGARRGVTADPAGNAVELVQAVGPFA